MPFISPSRAFIIRGYVYIPHAIERATRRDRGAGWVLYAIPFIMGLVLRCTGFYCAFGYSYTDRRCCACVWAFYAVSRGVSAVVWV